MSFMFNQCKKLKSLNISSFDTKNVTDMKRMFSYCEKLNNVDLSSFNIEKVANGACIFDNCNKSIITSNKTKFQKFI